MVGRGSGRVLNVYIESSAVLAWWLDQPGAASVRSAVESATDLIASELTCAECCRAFQRGQALGQLSPRQTGTLHRRAQDFWRQCHCLRFGSAVLEIACETLPFEPVRTLDAMHLGFLRMAERAWAPLVLLSLDARLRTVAATGGATVVPQLSP